MTIIPARNTDPATSHKAARSVALRANSQKAKLLRAFAAADAPMIDEEAAVAAGIVHPRACFWKRCGELRQLGLIEWAEVGGVVLEKKSTANEWCQASTITEQGRREAKRLMKE